MGVSEPDLCQRLENFLADGAGARAAKLLELAPLAGGAVQENWRLDAELADGPYRGRQAWVLRATAPAGIPNSHSRAEEFALLEVARAEGLAVPKPLFVCRDPAVFGRDFFIMERLAGDAAGYRLVRDKDLDGEALLHRLGTELGRMHRIRPPRADLGFLELPEPTPALEAVHRFQAQIQAHPAPHPAFEWGLRWLAAHAPEPQALVLCHRDFRTGNYLVAEGKLVGLLDWEFANWSDPMEDVGWFCAKCWRFGNAREAGGIGTRDAFYRAYEAASGLRIQPASVHYWEAMAHLRWGMIAVQQSDRHLGGKLPSLELALTGRLVAEMELELLALIDRAEGERG